MSNEVIEMHPNSVAHPTVKAAATPADIVLYAMQNGGSIEQIRDFMQLQREWEADQARKAFVADMAEFKKSPPEIVKDKLVGYKNKDGTVTGYTHATLGNVTEAIVSGLARCGFSHRWDTEQQGGNIVVTCILTHKLGHSERTSLSAVKDDSGKKNQIQQMASTITYLQRYTLLAATGVATKDQGDDDGSGAEPPAEKQAVIKEKIAGPRFEQALQSIRDGQYTPAEMREYYELTTDQETALADVEAK
jgi:hypothetical protein